MNGIKALPHLFHQSRLARLALAGLLVLALAWAGYHAWARPQPLPAAQASPLHPTFALLDQDGQNVLTSGQPVSTMQTCGACHDTAFIESHSFHSNLGLKDYTTAGETHAGKPWDASNGLFGKFDPLTYRYLTQSGDERLDLSTAGWLMLNAGRIPGGGPATTARDGQPLTSLSPDAANPEASLLDPQTGKATAWDWAESGVVEMNCLLCHSASPNNAARIAEIQAGDFDGAATATLLGSGIVVKSADAWSYNTEAFAENGELKPEFVQIQDPTNDNCAQCHGVVHTDRDAPLLLAACDLNEYQTATTGQVIASQRINESGLNLANKASLSRSWDIHAERALKCTDCHYSLNNPVHFQEPEAEDLEHLTYDPRRLEIGEYLKNPEHNFARGQSAQFSVAPENKGTMRRCESCHDAQKPHADWLPYTDRHMEVVACETCHIPQLYAPAIQSYDWTTLKAGGTPLTECRGIEGQNTVTDLVTGFKPVLMQRTNVDGDTLLAPYNLITTWFWIYDDANGNTRPVRLADLKAAFFLKDQYAAEILAAFDANGDGTLSDIELRLDTDAKQAAVKARLEALGLSNPRIYGQVQPYSINHNVARGEDVISDCRSCHNDQSLVNAPIQMASYTPGGVAPVFVQDTNVAASGQISSQDGALYYQPATEKDGIYVFGHNRVAWVDLLGALFFVGVLLAVSVHAALRLISALRHPKPRGPVEEVYMYDAYERFWHWLQTITIFLLLLTGLIIHRPDIFGAFSFPYVVTVHNVLAAILVVNAALSLFWHLVSGEIRQFIPRPYGFFDDAIVQAKYYLQGIFKGNEHPFEKTKKKKLNPLQQVTYFGLLNVLLPLQIITGALMWGVQQWPQVSGLLGGLPVLAPFHSLVAWLFASFIVAHVYLTTTGVTVFEDIRAMVTGWEKVEIHDETAAAGEHPADELLADEPRLSPSTGDAQA
jgi:thiosulfate reductase cytochrome b subunit/cytochrome c2